MWAIMGLDISGWRSAFWRGVEPASFLVLIFGLPQLAYTRQILDPNPNPIHFREDLSDSLILIKNYRCLDFQLAKQWQSHYDLDYLLLLKVFDQWTTYFLRSLFLPLCMLLEIFQ
ncbi:MAG: hypothetical protein ACI8P3_002181 [Saprospiraceae bacterium]|jgi:hypothetical protein